MSEQQSDIDKWSPCPPATLTALATALKRRQRRNQLQRIVTVVAAVLIAATAGQYVISQSMQSNGHSYGGISCSDVSRLLPDFVAGNIDESQRSKIEAHLQQCTSCRGLELQLREKQQKPVVGRKLSDELLLTSLDRTGR